MTALSHRVAVVTGASSGIGAGLAAMLAAEGAQVVLAARRAEALERVDRGVRQGGGVAVPVITEVTDDDSFANLALTRAELGPGDIRVNNAAYLCAAVLPDMQARGFGRVINIGSEAGVASVPGLAAYCVSKHALGAVTEVIQNANHDNGIKVWVVCPGFVDTEMGYVIPGANTANFLRVAEVVDVVCFLLHTGANVKVGPQVLVRTMRNPMPA